jgi:hypothetical protein
MSVAAGKHRDAAAISGPLEQIDLFSRIGRVYRGGDPVAIGQVSGKATMRRSGKINGTASS